MHPSVDQPMRGITTSPSSPRTVIKDGQTTQTDLKICRKVLFTPKVLEEKLYSQNLNSIMGIKANNLGSQTAFYFDKTAGNYQE